MITRPAPSSHWARSEPLLTKLDFWLWQVIEVYSPGDALPSTGKTAKEFVYKANLFRPDKGTSVDHKWKLAWQTTGPMRKRTDEEKRKRVSNAAGKLKMSPKMRKALQHAGRPRRKADRAKQSQQSKQSQSKTQAKKQPKSSFLDLMKSWEASAKASSSSAKACEVDETPKTLKHDNKEPMQSFLRPANVVGGGFGRNHRGMVPSFVRSYWDRHKEITT